MSCRVQLSEDFLLDSTARRERQHLIPQLKKVLPIDARQLHPLEVEEE